MQTLPDQRLTNIVARLLLHRVLDTFPLLFHPISEYAIARLLPLTKLRASVYKPA
jgi:hypothetical protein